MLIWNPRSPDFWIGMSAAAADTSPAAQLASDIGIGTVDHLYAGNVTDIGKAVAVNFVNSGASLDQTPAAGLVADNGISNNSIVFTINSNTAIDAPNNSFLDMDGSSSLLVGGLFYFAAHASQEVVFAKRQNSGAFPGYQAEIQADGDIGVTVDQDPSGSAFSTAAAVHDNAGWHVVMLLLDITAGTFQVETDLDPGAVTAFTGSEVTAAAAFSVGQHRVNNTSFGGECAFFFSASGSQVEGLDMTGPIATLMARCVT